MAKWRVEALARFPELRRTIDESREIMALWIELNMLFEAAYREPRNEDLIARVYAYADWCMGAPRNNDAGHDPATSVMVAFYEHIPVTRAAREDMPRWFTYDEVARSRGLFDYHLSPEQFTALLNHMRANQRRYVPRNRDKSK